VGFASFKKKNTGVAIVLGTVGAAIGAIAGVFIAIVVIAILIIVAIGFLLPYILE